LIGSNSTGHVSWYRRFLKRQHRLLHSRPVVIGNRLTDTELNRQALSDFIDTYSAWCSSRAYVPDDIINLDETRAELGRPVAPITTALTLQTNKVLMDYMRSTGCVTMLIAVSAAGSVILALFIYKHKDANTLPSVSVFVESADQVLARHGIHHAFSAVTVSGFMTKTLWVDVVKKTVELSTLHGDRDKLILYDASPTHKHDTLDLPNVTSLMIPPGMTSFLQPLDDLPFAN